MRSVAHGRHQLTSFVLASLLRSQVLRHGASVQDGQVLRDVPHGL
jgi:hypothetical protein